MVKKIKTGIIGLGFMGSTHFRIHQELGKSEIVAVADVESEKLKGNWSRIIGNIGDFDNSVSVDMSGIKTYSDAMDLINDPEIEMVDICVPTYLHARYALAALKKGKHVFCEKPIGRSVAEARQMTEEAEKSSGFFMNGLCVRYWPEYRHAWELYSSGALGKVISATFKRVSPSIHGNAWQDWFMKEELSGGALLDLHLHDTDLVRYFFGRPDSVTSFGSAGSRSDRGVDHIFTNYNYNNGTLIMAEGGWDAAKNSPFEMSFQIVCEKATIRLSEFSYKVVYEDGHIQEPAPSAPGLPTGWHVELDYFLLSVLKGEKPDKYLSTEEMCDSMAIIEAEELSVRENRSVEVQYIAGEYWVLGGFDGEKSAFSAIDDAASMGLDGIELTFGDCLKEDITEEECRDIATYAAEKGLGLRSLAAGFYWSCSLGSDDEAERERSVEFTHKYIKVASCLGVDRILLIPGAVDVGWDQSQPVTSYKNVWENSSASIRKLLPAAEQYNVTLCLENVWNKFLLSPIEFRMYLEQFKSSYVGIYFDVGNALLNGYPEHWIDILGDYVKAVHFKNFSRDDSGGLLHGFGDDLLKGDVNFPAVIRQLDAIGYEGPVTAEMIPFSRLPDLVLPDMLLARKTADALISLLK